jgi:hypothetical protein
MEQKLKVVVAVVALLGSTVPLNSRTLAGVTSKALHVTSGVMVTKRQVVLTMAMTKTVTTIVSSLIMVALTAIQRQLRRPEQQL